MVTWQHWGEDSGDPGVWTEGDRAGMSPFCCTHGCHLPATGTAGTEGQPPPTRVVLGVTPQAPPLYFQPDSPTDLVPVSPLQSPSSTAGPEQEFGVVSTSLGDTSREFGVPPSPPSPLTPAAGSSPRRSHPLSPARPRSTRPSASNRSGCPQGWAVPRVPPNPPWPPWRPSAKPPEPPEISSPAMISPRVSLPTRWGHRGRCRTSRGSLSP